MTRFIHLENCICILKDYLALVSQSYEWITSSSSSAVWHNDTADQTSWYWLAECWRHRFIFRHPPTDLVPCGAAIIIINCMLMRWFGSGNLHQSELDDKNSCVFVDDKPVYSIHNAMLQFNQTYFQHHSPSHPTNSNLNGWNVCECRHQKNVFDNSRCGKEWKKVAAKFHEISWSLFDCCVACERRLIRRWHLN